jgi:hypothetical protein
MTAVALQSRSKFPIRVQYGNETLNIPPQGRAEGLIESLIGAIPDGVVVLKPTQPETKHIFKKNKEKP